MDKIIVNDPFFGSMAYHKKFLNAEFNGKQYLCEKPFTYAEIRHTGDVNVCCPDWNPVTIGNLLHDSLENIWNSERAKVLRQTILDGSYKYCNFDTCLKIHKRLLLDHTPENRQLMIEGSERTTPTTLYLVVDKSCNLECPSCRITKLPFLPPDRREKAYTIISRALDDMFSKPHDQYKSIYMDGSGEVFSSEVYRRLFETHDVFTKTDQWPNLRFRIVTNGTLMTPKIQKRYYHLFDHLEELSISIDAGNKQSYEKVRVGGHWEMLWENMKYFYDNTILPSDDKSWVWNIIIQKNNYESLIELIESSKKFPEKQPKIHVSNLINWGTWSEEQYLYHAVHIPTHPEHQRYLDIIALVEKEYGYKF